jgi:hypothetical protein
MEPRPPRPRSSRQFETPGPPPTPGIGERLYPATDQTYYPGAETYEPGAAEPPLLPRQQRRQRRALRGIVVTLVLVALIAALGWVFRDTIRGLFTPTSPPPTVIAQTNGNSNIGAPGTPDAPTSAALPNALATVTPTPATAAATATVAPVIAEEEQPAEEGEEPAEADSDISAQTMPLLDLLPTQEQVPAGLILSDEAERSKAEVIESLGGSDEAAQLLDDWGWSGNAYRDFVAPEGGEAPPSGTTLINVSVHRFADAESAANALVFFSDQVIFGQGLQEVEPPAIGKSARLLLGAPVAVLYVQDGPIMYRFGGSSGSAEIDPSPDVIAVAAAIIPSQADGG